MPSSNKPSDLEAPAVIVPDDPEHGPDPNSIRRHQKKMLSSMDYLRKYRRIGFYRPSPKQKAFHDLMAVEKAVRAGNQTGKSTAGAAQMTMDAIQFYPAWYEGHKFLTPPAIERPFDFLGWYSCTTSATTRDGCQTKLLGDIRQSDGLGTGLIPLDNIVGRPTMARGIADFVDTITLRREGGGRALLRGKTYEMDRRAFQGESCDEVWLDEDVSRDNDTIYGECLARLTTTRGRLFLTLTPLLGLSPIRKRFKERSGRECDEVLMSIEDAAVSKGGHIPDEDIPAIIARYSERERAARAYGHDLQGEGAVFTIPVSDITFPMNTSMFHADCEWILGLDLSHGGMSASAHPFAAVAVCLDPYTKVAYVAYAARVPRALPAVHVDALRKWPVWQATCAYPHDGGRTADMTTGATFVRMYKRLGLNMRPTNASLRGGGISLEAGIVEMENMFANGSLKIASHLSELLDEYAGYHRIDGKVHKVDDDLLSALRVAIMDLRYARPLPGPGIYGGRPRQETRFARGTANNDPIDPFTGRSASDDRPGTDPFGGGGGYDPWGR